MGVLTVMELGEYGSVLTPGRQLVCCRSAVGMSAACADVWQGLFATLTHPCGRQGWIGAKVPYSKLP